MASSVRRALNEVALSICAFGVLLLALAASDVRVREQVTHLSRPTAEAVSAGQFVAELAATVFQAVHDQSLAHAPLMLFVLVGGALLLFMLRT